MRDDIAAARRPDGVYVETVLGPNPWAIGNGGPGRTCQNCGRGHCCYFCQRVGCYDPMPSSHTLCARCGQLIFGDVTPMNEEMVVCEKCDHEIAAEDAVHPIRGNSGNDA